jgi:lincosamide and streptogramin A transport system ATP-binding/permease protein
MAQINVTNLTFGYDGSFDYIFENVSFSVDTDWKLGFIGRNGKGKTTFLNLLLGKYEYTGSISTNAVFDYFPYKVASDDLGKNADDLMDMWKPGVESWRVLCELPQLSLDPEILYRPFSTLSFGERTKIMLAVLFSGENDFLLIDEPTNHLDMASREIVKRYIAGKKGFILVSHDRDLLDAYIGAKTKKMQSRVKTFENRIPSPEISCPIIGPTQSTNSQNIAAHLLNPPPQQYYLLTLNKAVNVI